MTADRHLQSWKQREELAEAMLPLVGKLYRDRNVILSVFGRSLVHESAINILKAHRYARQLVGQELSIHESCSVLTALSKLDLAPARIDLGKLTTQYQKVADKQDIPTFLQNTLATIINQTSSSATCPRDVVLYGFGRIGRLIGRVLIDQTGSGENLRLKAIVVRPSSINDLAKRASLIRRDSVHGPFKGTIQVDETQNAIIANGNVIQLIHSVVVTC